MGLTALIDVAFGLTLRHLGAKAWYRRTGGLKIACQSGYRAHLCDFEWWTYSWRTAPWLSDLTHS
jgi:hypothetical protein